MGLAHTSSEAEGSAQEANAGSRDTAASTTLVARLVGFLRRHRFLRSVAMLAGGTALGQAITIAVAPILSRLYSPAEFGLLSVCMSTLSIVCTVAAFQYQIAIPLPEKDEDGANLLVLCLAILMATTLGFTAVLWRYQDVVLGWVNGTGLKPYLWVLPVGFVGQGLYMILSCWAVRKRTYRILATTKLAQSIVTAGSQLLLGALTRGPLGLLIGSALGSYVGNGALARAAWRDSARAFLEVRVRGMLVMASRYRKFPAYETWSGLLHNTVTWAPPLIISGLYGTTTAGLFSITVRVLTGPLTLVGSALAQVYVGESVEMNRQSPASLRALFKRVTMYTLLYSTCYVVPVGLLGPPLFSVVFGKEWGEAGEYVRLLMPLFILQGTSVPMSVTRIAIERPDLLFATEIVRIVLVPGSFVLAHRLGYGPLGAMALYCVAGSVGCLWHLGLMWLGVQAHVRRAAARGNEPAGDS